MMIMNLTDIHGNAVFINPMHIVWFRAFNNTQTFIYLSPIVTDVEHYGEDKTGLLPIHVKESVDEVTKMFRVYSKNS